MGMMTWLKQVLGASAIVNIEALPDEVEGLNFASAIEAHDKWKQRLGAVISGESNEKLDVATVCRDDQCLLGKWLHGVGGDKFGGAGSFAELRSSHAAFHQCAGKILEAAQHGHCEEATKLLGGRDYVVSSERVKVLLTKVYSEVHTLKH